MWRWREVSYLAPFFKYWVGQKFIWNHGKSRTNFLANPIVQLYLYPCLTIYPERNRMKPKFVWCWSQQSFHLPVGVLWDMKYGEPKTFTCLPISILLKFPLARTKILEQTLGFLFLVPMSVTWPVFIVPAPAALSHTWQLSTLPSTYKISFPIQFSLMYLGAKWDKVLAKDM